jgi:hypothetical protein
MSNSRFLVTLPDCTYCLEGKFKYIAPIIALICFEYFFVVAMFYLSRYCACLCCKRDFIPEAMTPSGKSIKNPRHDSEWKFEDTYQSFYPGLKYLLFVTRFLSFCYICGVSVIANYAERTSFTWFFFTTWNVQLISFYFLFALSASIIGFIHDGKSNASGNTGCLNYDIEGGEEPKGRRKIWSQHTINFGYVIHILFEVCSGTAVLVTLVAFIAINSSSSFWNVAVHLMNVLVMILELFLNNMYLRLDHIPYNLTWAFIYVIFMWSIVVMGNITFWPYPFLAVDTYYSFFFYTGTIVADIVAYIIFFLLALAKFHIREALGLPTKLNIYEGSDETDPYVSNKPVISRENVVVVVEPLEDQKDENQGYSAGGTNSIKNHL